MADADAALAAPGQSATMRAHFAHERANHAGLLAILDRRLAVEAAYRDRLAAAPREPGCFCLGLGGRGNLRPVVEEFVWDEWCPCTAGRALQAAWEQALAAGAAEDAARAAAEAAEATAARRAWLLRKANIPHEYRDATLDTFPTAPENAALLHVLRAYGRPSPAYHAGQRLDPDALEPLRTSLYLYGAQSLGKTGLAVGIVRAWIAADRQAHFIRVGALLRRLRATFSRRLPDDETTEDVLMEYIDVPLLVLDDLGGERVSPWVAEQLYELLDSRKNKRPRGTTIITSNYPLRMVAERLSTPDNPEQGRRITERIIEMCDRGRGVIRLTGPNLRRAPGVDGTYTSAALAADMLDREE